MFILVANKECPIVFLNLTKFKVSLLCSEKSLVEIPAKLTQKTDFQIRRHVAQRCSYALITTQGNSTAQCVEIKPV